MDASFLRGNLRSIEVFLSVMENGTTQRAAELLYTTQPTISKTIARLESLLGVELFVRSGGRLKPTNYAFRLLREAELIQTELAGFERRVRQIKDDAEDGLWFEAVSTLSIAMVPRAIARLKQIHPDIKITFNISQTDQILLRAKKNLIDFGLLHFPTDTPYPGAQKLNSSELVCIVPKGHFLTKKKMVTPQDLQPFPLVSYRASLPYTKLIESAFHEYGLRYEASITVNHSVALYSLVNAGYGAAIVDNFFATDGVFPNIERIPFSPKREVTVGLIVADQKELSKQALTFIEYLRDPLELK
ncbi:LysR family transcriptional regulator [Pusillimonas sp. ANT_WB101]|uniref:LysR family transcriptional regulator n=1 Tax=Pusillimonas sp. ANT_WB101 TaxID=2597356 RepID=UPI0011EE4ABA|nr:LysR substrate-binding domain-containing protein [Pusillimonas sp. ANT_WB101]KAA0911346.1 LysR family transcriptional regulator [Pusillimonas sp. ANT_WB101]